MNPVLAIYLLDWGVLSYIGVDMREQKQGVCRFQIEWRTQY